MIFFLLTICLATWVFYFFARRKRCTTYKRCGWFHNYECSSRRFDFVTISVFAESWFFLAQALLAILESSLLSVFLHTTMREVVQAATSKAGRLGCLTKYVPWVIAVFHIIWLFSIGACLVFIAIGGCQKRLNAHGLQAILNCRMYFSMCCSGNVCGNGLMPKDVHQCNSLVFLSAYGFLKNPIAIEVAQQMCNHIENLVPPENGVVYCTPQQSTWECFGDDQDISDFGKTFILYTVWSSLAYTLTTSFFIIVKLATPLESFFFQVSNPNEFFLVHYSRKFFTPWG